MWTRNKIKNRVIAFSIAAAIAVWVLDAAFDAFLFHHGAFLDLLFLDVSAHEIYFRLLFVVSFISFGVVIAYIISRRDRAEEMFRRHSAAMEASLDGIAIYDRDDKYLYVNKAYASINGYENPGEVIGKSYKTAYDEIELERMDQVCMPALQRNGHWRGELLARRKNGSTYYQEVSATMLEDGSRVCIVRDITWRKRSEDRLRRSERFLNTLFDSIRDPFCIYDRDFQVIRVNDAYALMKNRLSEELIGNKCHVIQHNSDVVCEGCVVNKTFQSADPCAKEKSITLQDGTEIWVEIYTYPILDEEGRVSHVMEYTRDITDRRKSEDEKTRLIEKLEHLSRTDSLTGLMNRRALTNSLIYEMDRAKRYGAELALILCDIDNFKEINDMFGHDTGDRALQIVSATLKTILRKADFVGRYGGDEFMLILPETSDKGAEDLAEKLLSAVRGTDLRSNAGAPISMSMSIGVAWLDAAADDVDSLIRRVDDAMYASKQAGKDRVSSSISS